MIIDAHTHLFEPGSLLSESMNGDPDLLLEMLDNAGIDKAVVLAIAPHDRNEYLADVCRKHPDRLIAFLSVDPSSTSYDKPDSAIVALREQAASYPFKGIKLHPRIQGFSIADVKLTAFFQAIADLELPVMLDCISWRSLVPLADSLPLEVDRLLRRVPKLRVILAHMGGHRVLDAYAVAQAHSDVYLDLSWVMHLFAGSSIEQDIKFVVKKLAPLNRIIFGSDFPIHDRENTLPIAVSREMCLKMFRDIELTAGEVDQIMGGTIARLLGLL